MPRRELPAACRWSPGHLKGNRILMYNFGTVALVGNGSIWLSWGGTSIKAPHLGSMAQGMRFAERWVAAREGLPGQRRALKAQAAAPAKRERRRQLDAQWRARETTPRPAPLPSIKLWSGPAEPGQGCIDISADLLTEYHNRTDGWD